MWAGMKCAEDLSSAGLDPKLINHTVIWLKTVQMLLSITKKRKAISTDYTAVVPVNNAELVTMYYEISVHKNDIHCTKIFT